MILPCAFSAAAAAAAAAAGGAVAEAAVECSAGSDFAGGERMVVLACREGRLRGQGEGAVDAGPAAEAVVVGDPSLDSAVLRLNPVQEVSEDQEEGPEEVEGVALVAAENLGRGA